MPFRESVDAGGIGLQIESLLKIGGTSAEEEKVPVPLDPKLLRLINELIGPAQSVQEFVDGVVRAAIARRTFISNGIRARDRARRTGAYVSSMKVLRQLEEIVKNRGARGS